MSCQARSPPLHDDFSDYFLRAVVACAALAFTKGYANATLNPCPCQDVIRFGFPHLLSLQLMPWLSKGSSTVTCVPE